MDDHRIKQSFVSETSRSVLSFDILHIYVLMPLNFLESLKVSEFYEKRWHWLATFPKNAGRERVKLLP